MNKALIKQSGDDQSEQKELVRSMIAKGCTDDEIKLFFYVAKHRGLDPLLGQIHAVKRWSSAEKKKVMSIQTGIDGYRLIADRTGEYCPGKEPTYTYDSNGDLKSATAYVERYYPVSGEWKTISATAFYSEYVSILKDGKPNSMWKTKPHIMLTKCAESLALRKAFPAKLSGIYTNDEMQQADNEITSKAITTKTTTVEMSDGQKIGEALKALYEAWKPDIKRIAKETNKTIKATWQKLIHEALDWAHVVENGEDAKVVYATRWTTDDVYVFEQYLEEQLKPLDPNLNYADIGVQSDHPQKSLDL